MRQKKPQLFVKKTRKKSWTFRKYDLFPPPPKKMYVEEYTAGHLCNTFEEFILNYEAMISKNEFDLLLVVNYVKVTKLKLNMSFHLLNVCNKF